MTHKKLTYSEKLIVTNELHSFILIFACNAKHPSSKLLLFL